MKRIPCAPSFAFVLGLFCAALLLAMPAHAQPELEEADRRLIGREIARVGIIDFRNLPEATPRDAAIAAELLEIGHGFMPDEPIVLRYLVEAYRTAGNDEKLIDATRRLVAADEDDEVAQLRLISWSISKRQTAEQRLAAYSQWLDGRGADVLREVPAVRSRLALDAALLHRELGDDEGFIQRLTQATNLDSSHKEAASLAATVFSQRSDDKIAQLELTINVLLADPIDVNLHLSIGEQLAAMGAFEGSRRFYANAVRLIRTAGGDSETPALVQATTALEWHLNGPAAVLSSFESQLRTLRGQARRIRENLLEMGRPVDGTRDPDEILLDIERERYRLYAALAVGDRVSAERSITDLDSTIGPLIQRVQTRLESLTPDEEALRGQLVGTAISFATETITARLIADVQSRTAAGNLGSLTDAYGEQVAQQLELISAIADMRTVSAQSALPELEAFSERSLLGAVAYGLALEEVGRTQDAVSSFLRAAEFAPLTAAGVFAMSKAEALGGEMQEHPRVTEAVAVAQAVPVWVDRATMGPEQFMRLNAVLDEASISSHGESRLTIELRNLLPRPLSVGGDRSVGTRFAIVPSVESGPYRLPGTINPEVVDLQRKLRLEPGEAYRTTVWPDAGSLGWLTSIKSAHRIRSRYNALQNFKYGGITAFAKGPLSLSSETRVQFREPDRNARLAPEDMLRYAETADERALLGLLPTYRSALLDLDYPSGTLGDTDARALAREIANRYPRLSRDLRLAVITILPSRHLRPVMQAVDEVVSQDADPDLMKLAMVTRVADADDELLSRAMDSGDPELADFASRLADRISSGIGGGFVSLRSPPSHVPPEIEEDGAR